LSKTYTNCSTKLIIKCNNNHIYNVSFNSFKNGNRCAICAGLKLSNDDVKRIIEIESNSNYKLLNSYKNAKTKLKIMCDKGHIYEVLFYSFRNGNRCPKCAGNEKHSFDYVKKYIEEDSLSGYILLDTEYKGVNRKLKVKCSKGHIYYPTFASFKNGNRCLYCYGNIKHTFEYVKQYVENISNSEYILLSNKYININNKLKIKCNKNHTYYVSFLDFKSGRRCPKCAGKNRTIDDVKQFIEIDSNSGYKVLSLEYVNAISKLEIKCDKGHIYYVDFHKFKHGNRCPICNESKGEKKIELYFNNNNISYIPQYKFDDCKNILKLPFDFAVFNNDNLLFLIEYHGKQHYKPVDYFGGEEGYIYRKNNDAIKKNYCKVNTIDLLEIPYYNYDNIEIILNSKLQL
jgi:hypothetical protein